MSEASDDERTFEADVLETRVVRCVYTVSAKDEAEAAAKLSRGETEASYDINVMEVVNREIATTITPVASAATAAKVPEVWLVWTSDIDLDDHPHHFTFETEGHMTAFLDGIEETATEFESFNTFDEASRRLQVLQSEQMLDDDDDDDDSWVDDDDDDDSWSDDDDDDEVEDDSEIEDESWAEVDDEDDFLDEEEDDDDEDDEDFE